MGWVPLPPPPEVAIENAGLFTPNELRRLAKSYRETPQAYKCQSCGAPVRSHEQACTYCTTERGST